MEPVQLYILIEWVEKGLENKEEGNVMDVLAVGRLM